MRSVWQRLQSAPIRLRWPAKWVIFAVVLFLVLYPYPGLFVRHVSNLRRLNELPDSRDPAVAEAAARFEAFLSHQAVPGQGERAVLEAVNTFVCREIPYGWDWDVWGVADYVPTATEVLARGTEDCDGRAVLAAALLRSRGIDARIAGDLRHMWVRTPHGDTMSPLGDPVLTVDDQGAHVRWPRLLDLGPLAIGISLFPFGRELIILLTLWLLLLPPAVRWKRAAIGLFLLLEALVILRLAGDDPLEPNYAAIRWGLLHLLFVVVALRRNRTKQAEHTGRSVF